MLCAVRPIFICRSRPYACVAGTAKAKEAILRTLIVDDHPVVISGCRALLAAEPDIEVFAAQDAEAGLAAFEAHAPDVAVIDINLPGRSGFDLAGRILARHPEARIVMFSMNDDPAFAARAIAVGAKGYVPKNDDPALFVTALRQVCAGGTYVPAELAKKMAFDRNSQRLAALSPREMEILRLLAAGDSLYAIADKLGVSDKTVANNCTALKSKLGARTSMDLMRMALEALGQ